MNSRSLCLMESLSFVSLKEETWEVEGQALRHSFLENFIAFLFSPSHHWLAGPTFSNIRSLASARAAMSSVSTWQMSPNMNPWDQRLGDLFRLVGTKWSWSCLIPVRMRNGWVMRRVTLLYFQYWVFDHLIGLCRSPRQRSWLWIPLP